MHSAITKRQTFDRFFTEAEERKLLAYLRTLSSVLARRDLAWIELLRCTGIRVSTLSLLTVSDARSWLTTGRVDFRDEISKGGRGHELHLTKRARKAVQSLLQVRREQGFANIGESPLVMSRNNRGLCVRSYQMRFRQWCRAAGLARNFSPHFMRHTLAKRIMAHSTSTDPLGMVQSALGHRSRDTTVIYTLPDREQVALAMEEAS